jgi:single-stranded-DNA-specific exonuclease
MRWVDHPPSESAYNALDIHQFSRRILLQRGVTSENDINAFIDPSLYKPSLGTDIPGLAISADRIETAIKRKESICVWGDFDADGQTATTVLVQMLRAIGADVTYHIPIRAAESHGVNIPNLKLVIDQGASLVVTCDTGTSAHEAVEYARSRNVDFVITDHHDLPDSLPMATAITNPKLLPSGHPLGNLAGVGVAYKLAEELLFRNKSKIHPNTLLDLVAIGMVADLAILSKDSRYLVQKGLAQLAVSERLGLKVMMELAEITSSNLNEEHIGFVLGPRLNALGRLGDANPAVELLTTSNPVRARVFATQLEGLNVQRKLLCDQVVQGAESQLENNPSLLSQPVLILSHPSWPGGVVGIAASKMVDRYGKPAILFSTPANEPARGSARSIEGLNITEAISFQKDILLGFGGHPMAAGLSLTGENLPDFRRRLNKTVEAMLGENQTEEKTLTIDGWVELEMANLDLAAEIEKLAPFGPGNRKPVLCVRNLSIKDKAEIGKNNEHLKITVENEPGKRQDVLWWDGSSQQIPEGRFDLAFSIRGSNWKGVRQAQLVWIDARQVETESISVTPTKPQILDYRSCGNQKEVLETLPKGTILWVEGPDRKRLTGMDRNTISAAKSIAIWTSPPSTDVLRRVINTVHPERVYLFACDPGMDEVTPLLERLAGLIKYTISHKAGQALISELAAACAQTENVIRKGLELFIQSDQITVDFLSQDSLQLRKLRGKAITRDSDNTLDEFQALLLETSAYRKFFFSANTDSLLP